MSGTPPLIYLELNNGLTTLGPDALQYVADSDEAIIVVVEGVDLFEPGCITTTREVEGYPFNSYNIDYPYCRTALQINMGDKRDDPQIGQLVVSLPFLAVRLVFVGCEYPGITSVTSKIEPAALYGCAAEVFPGNTSDEIFFIVEKSGLSLPARFTFTINGSRTFWIGLRDSRSGRPSGSVV